MAARPGQQAIKGQDVSSPGRARVVDILGAIQGHLEDDGFSETITFASFAFTVLERRAFCFQALLSILGHNPHKTPRSFITTLIQEKRLSPP